MATYRTKVCTVTVETGRLLELGRKIQKKAHALLDKTAFDIEATAKSLAAVDTGAMRSSVYVSGASGGSNYEQRRAEAAGKAAGGGKQVEFNPEIRARNPYERVIAPSVAYGIFPELQGQPYIAPAVETHRANFVKAWKGLVE